MIKLDSPEYIKEKEKCNQTATTSALEGIYCPRQFDTWRCWPATKANTTVYVSCPSYVEGFDGKKLAHKDCMPDGTWFKHPNTNKTWSNYTQCAQPSSEQGAADMITAVYETGYAVSILALLISLGVLSYFKSLRCARNTVHKHLFASFTVNNALWLLYYGRVVAVQAVLKENPMWCLVLHGLLHYVLITNYAWMLCEGLYLHTVLVRAFVAETRLLRALAVLGWAMPVPFAIIYVILRHQEGNVLCWTDEPSKRALSALMVPVMACVIINVGFLCNIVRVLCIKMRAPAGAAARPSTAALQGLRAACLLAPLFGVNYILLPFKPEKTHPAWVPYEIIAALCTSLQGLLVAILFCFCNGEVVSALKRKYRTLSFRTREPLNTHTTVSWVRGARDGGEGDCSDDGDEAGV